MIGYEVIKVYEDDTESQPLSLTYSEEIVLNCSAPFKISYQYGVQDWFTNQLNNFDRNSDRESYTKLPIGLDCPFLVEFTSISNSLLTIHKVSLDIIERDVFELKEIN